MATFGILLSDDLLFTSRIAGTARALGLDIKTARSVDDLRRLVVAAAPACVVLDLQHPGLNATALVAELKGKAPCRVIAYGSHVAADVLAQARTAGCDVVLPRSKFIDELESELPKWFGSNVG